VCSLRSVGNGGRFVFAFVFGEGREQCEERTWVGVKSLSRRDEMRRALMSGSCSLSSERRGYSWFQLCLMIWVQGIVTLSGPNDPSSRGKRRFGVCEEV